ncbi:MAG TPA: efflux RND transporter periplasmic adaptor subunit [Spirochaetia bacterium]|nr:efflux RND transporter periplasmic adaptor subunit [Spirochaetia bacterium]
MSNDESRKRFPMRYLVLLLLVGLAAVVWFVLERPRTAPAEQAPLPVDVVLPGVGTIEKTMTIYSYVKSDSVVTILPKVSGTLLSLDAGIGTILRAGETVAQIDPQPYRLALDQARAQYDGAKSAYDRTNKLYDAGSASRQNYDQALAQYQNAQSQYELAQLQLGYTTISSPVDGTVIQRHVSQGALVSPSVPLVTISNAHTLVIETEVPEMDARTFEKQKSSMQIRAVIPAMGANPYTLRIRNIAPAINVHTRTFAVQCEIDGDTADILPGMFAVVTFVVDHRSSVAYLPFTALVGGDRLWFVNSSGTAESIAFTPSFSNNDYFEIPSQYADRRFILSGQHFLSAGARVKVASTTRAGT